MCCRDAEFIELSCNLTAAQIELYDGAVEMWWTIRSEMVQALSLCSIKRKDLWKTFWSAQQRFFKLLCVCLKVSLHLGLVCLHRHLKGSQLLFSPPTSWSANILNTSTHQHLKRPACRSD